MIIHFPASDTHALVNIGGDVSLHNTREDAELWQARDAEQHAVWAIDENAPLLYPNWPDMYHRSVLSTIR